MPRFMRTNWSKPAANAPEGESVVVAQEPEMAEELERLKEAEFVRSLQNRLMSDDSPAANEDTAPGVENIFAPYDGKDD